MVKHRGMSCALLVKNQRLILPKLKSSFNINARVGKNLDDT